ncbi:hypothetical protein D0865_15096 [Hortaea werneckii]|uniref:RBR-type E3 ubiquitin transferase n=1 Tax=Hortaea werneckii TaxID=91943 RepID=A0A3M7AUK7_HORWE|nr:hypothetical protein D0865_15096 [Hortaea werneckii]
MATTSSAGSSRRSSRTARPSKANAHGSKHRERAVKVEQEVKEPDVEELRRRRAAYYGRPVAEKQKIIRTRPASTSSTSSKTKTRSSNDLRHKKKSSSFQRSTASSNRSKTSRRREKDDSGLVYAAPPLVGEASSEGRSKDEDRAERRRHSRRSSSYSSNLESLPESELAPEDSISMVAQRQSSGSRSSNRPNLKRSNTTSSKLPPISEKPDGSPDVANRRSSKRESTLFGALFRRNTTNAKHTPEPPPPRLVECLTCASDDVPYSSSAKLACGHRMCHECLKRVFEMSVKDPAHMPPRCCTDDHIPLKHVDKLFDLRFKTHWNRKYQEYHTKNRIYCPAPKCGEWIKPSHIHKDKEGKKYAACPRCKLKVCTLCNNKAHKSRDCPKDPEIVKLVEQAKEKGWQRCYNCSSLVELKEGCNHMTCRCMAQFCMICGSKWKTCECPWFNYTSLPNPDRLNDMRVPEPIRVIYRRVMDATAPAGRPQPPPAADAAAAAEQRQRQAPPPPMPRRTTTYQDELEQRRRQERLDADLARRLQLASLMDNNNNSNEDEPSPRQRAQAETFGVGNATGHFMNDDYVRNAANVVMNAFGDANMGRRGERASGRRRRARQPNQNGGDHGLAPNFLGDASVLGI